MTFERLIVYNVRNHAEKEAETSSRPLYVFLITFSLK